MIQGKPFYKTIWFYVIVIPLFLYVIGKYTPENNKPSKYYTKNSGRSLDRKEKPSMQSEPLKYQADYKDVKMEDASTRSSSQSIEEEIRDFAKREYPNDYSMQNYVYNNQLSAYKYMLTVTDSEVKKIAIHEYSNDYSMQKYVYGNQLSAKHYMKTVADEEVKKIAIHEYSNDYSMQKYVYDTQFSAKQYMGTVTNPTAKSRAEREYPNDYSMQKYVYEGIVYRN